MTPTLSVEAFHDSDTLLLVTPVTLRLPGVDGAVVSGPPVPLVVPVTLLDRPDWLFAASRART